MDKKFKFFENQYVIFISLFFIFFVFSLPALWKSTKFSLTEKWIYSIISVVETGFILNKFTFVMFKVFERYALMGQIINQIHK